MGTRQIALLPLLGALAAACVGGNALAAEDYETPPAAKASQLLPKTVLKGPHHTIDEAVPLQGLFYRYRIQSTFGTFEAVGSPLLAVRLKEIDALERLSGTSEFSVAMKSVGDSLATAAKGAAHAVANPEETVKGIPGGVGRAFGRIGRKAKRTAEKGQETVDKDEKEEGAEAKTDEKATTETATNASASVAKGALGVSASRRRWAKELGVDPYTSNPALSAALDKVAEIDAAGRFATKLVPGMAALSAVSNVDSLVYEKEPDELMTLNETRLKAMGVDGGTSRDLRLNKNIRLGPQTRIVGALDAMKGVADRDAFIERAASADDEVGAHYFAVGAEILERFHRTQAPLVRIVPARAAAVALAKNNRLVHLLPVDSVSWTKEVAEAANGATQRAKEDFTGSKPELWTSGRVSVRARKELESRGWAVHERSLRPPEIEAALKAAAPKK